MDEIRESVVLENNGQKIFGILHHPAEGMGPFPTILCCHGFAGNKVGKHRFYVDFASTMAKKGFVVFRFDFRGSGDSEGTLQEMTLSGEVSDAITALNYLMTVACVDQERIGFLGRSMGGLVSVLTAAQSEIPVAALCLWAPVFSSDDWKERVAKSSGPTLSIEERTRLSRINGQTPNALFIREFFSIDLTKILPTLHTIPLLHIHGEEDAVVSLAHADAYQKQRQEATASSEFIRFPKSNHDFSNDEERDEALLVSAQWFDKMLQKADKGSVLQ